MLLITGSSGLIGTNLALRLLDRGHDVLGVDLRENPWTDRIPTVLGDLCDLCDDGCDVLGDILTDAGVDDRQITGVVHLAAIARVYQSVCEPDNSLRNLRMVHVALEFCRRRALPILFSSSREVYGDLEEMPGCVGESLAVPARTASPYAAGKLAAEAYISAYARSFDLPTLIVRLSNVYGRYDSDIERMDRVIPLFISRISSGEPVTVYGPEKMLDFTYIDDCVGGIMLGLDRLIGWGSGRQPSPVAGLRINIAAGQGHTIVELAQMIGRELGCEPKISLAPSRPGEVRRYVADISIARNLLGYRPGTCLADGVRKTISWWKESRQLPVSVT